MPAKFVFAVAEREMLIPPFGNAARVQLATTWMNEEWYNDRIRSGSDPNWVCTLHRPHIAQDADTNCACGDTGFYSDLITIFGLIKS